MAETQGCARPTRGEGWPGTNYGIRLNHLRNKKGDFNVSKSWAKGPRFPSPGLSPG